jgi:hypothetical protein
MIHNRRYLPSIEALVSNDEERLTRELRLSEVREQVALVESLLDTLDASASARADGPEQPAREGPGEAAQPDATDVAEELARVGCRIVELATALRGKHASKRAPAKRGLRDSRATSG